MARAGGEPRRAPDALRVVGHVRDPSLGVALRGVPQPGRPLVRREVVAHEREHDRGLGAREHHVEGLDSQGAARALAVLGHTHGGPDPFPVPEREHCDHEPARQLDLVVERPDQRAVTIGERGAGGERSRRKSGGVVEHAVQDVRRDEPAAAGRFDGVERGEHH